MKRISSKTAIALAIGIFLVGLSLICAAEEAITQITIDGDPADWASYEVSVTDPSGDHQGGGFDIAAVRVFANDSFLYVLIETHGSRENYVQVDLDIRAAGRQFVVSFSPEERGPGFMGDVTGGVFEFIGEVVGSSSAAAAAVEFRIPLSAFGEITKVRESSLVLLNVRPMGGKCCNPPGWYSIDQANYTRVSVLAEREAKGTLEITRVCANGIPPPVPFGTLEPAPIRLTQSEYSAEWFVAPGKFNMPQEVLLTPAGDLFVCAVRGHKLFRVTNNGTVKLVAKDVFGYLGDVDAQGNLYLHFHPGGRVTRFSPSGKATVVVESPQIKTACDSGFGFGPDGNMYLALTPCSNKSDLFRITPRGQITRVAVGIEQLQALHTAPDGRFLAASRNAVYELSLQDYSLKLLGRIPSSRGVSPGGSSSRRQWQYLPRNRRAQARWRSIPYGPPWRDRAGG